MISTAWRSYAFSWVLRQFGESIYFYNSDRKGNPKGLKITYNSKRNCKTLNLYSTCIESVKLEVVISSFNQAVKIYEFNPEITYQIL